MSARTWTPKHIQALQDKILEAGIEPSALAATHLFGKSQMANLLGADNKAFYSESIRYASGVKVLKSLGFEDSQIQALHLGEDDLPDGTVTEAQDTFLAAHAPLTSTVAASVTPPPATTPQPNHVSPKPRSVLWPVLIVGVLAYGFYLGFQALQGPATKDTTVPTALAEQTPLATPPENAASAPTAAASTSPMLGLPPTQALPITAATVVDAVDICDFSKTTADTQVIASQATGPKGYVHFSANEHSTLLCTKDRKGQVVKVELAAHASRSVYGEAPFTVNFSKDRKPTVFYQQTKVNFGAGTVRAIFE